MAIRQVLESPQVNEPLIRPHFLEPIKVPGSMEPPVAEADAGPEQSGIFMSSSIGNTVDLLIGGTRGSGKYRSEPKKHDMNLLKRNPGGGGGGGGGR